MFNNNSITAEVRITRAPERSDRADVVKAGGAIFQGKKEDNKTPMWVDLNAWKYTGKCLETLAKNDVVIVTGSLSQEFWTSNQDGTEKSKLVITCETIGKKVWADNSGGQQQQQNQNQNQNQNQGGYQQPPQQGGGFQNQNQGYDPGGFQQPGDQNIPF